MNSIKDKIFSLLSEIEITIHDFQYDNELSNTQHLFFESFCLYMNDFYLFKLFDMEEIDDFNNEQIEKVLEFKSKCYDQLFLIYQSMLNKTSELYKKRYEFLKEIKRISDEKTKI